MSEAKPIAPIKDGEWLDIPGAGLALLGAFLLLVGIGVAFHALTMEISVHIASEYSAVGGFTPAQDVVNYGKMQNQLLTFLCAAFVGLAGAIFFGCGRIMMFLSGGRPRSARSALAAPDGTPKPDPAFVRRGDG